MGPIYGVMKFGMVRTPPGVSSLMHAMAYANTVGGEIHVSHDDGATWQPYEPTDEDRARLAVMAALDSKTFVAHDR